MAYDRHRSTSVPFHSKHFKTNYITMASQLSILVIRQQVKFLVAVKVFVKYFSFFITVCFCFNHFCLCCTTIMSCYPDICSNFFGIIVQFLNKYCFILTNFRLSNMVTGGRINSYFVLQTYFVLMQH